MPITAPDERTLKAYLLGDLSAEREEAVDSWILSSEDAETLLSGAEEDLIDDSISGRLDARELNRFTNFFLQTAERQQKYQFGQMFQRAVQNHSRTQKETAAPKPAGRPAWTGLARLFQIPSFGYAMAAASVLLAAGMAWSLMRSQAIEQRLDVATSERDRLQTNLNGAQASAEDLRSQMTAFNNALAGAESPAILEVSSGRLRSGNGGLGGLKEVSISGKAALRVSLLFPDSAKYDSFRATLVDADGRKVGSGLGFPAIAAPKSPNLTVMLPAELPRDGEYSLKLSGSDGSRQPDDLGRYYFSVKR